MNKIKSKLLKKINKTDKTLPRLIKKRLKAKHQPGLQISQVLISSSNLTSCW